jgi:WD40 repeat protein
LILEKLLAIEGHGGAIYDILADERFIYSASADKFVTRWKIESGEQDSFAIKTEVAPYSIGLDSTNQHLWIGLANGDIHVIDLKSRLEVKYFQQHKKAVFSIFHLAKSNQVIAADADGNLSVWDSEKLKLLVLLPLNCGKIRHISSDITDELLFLHCQDDKIRILETKGFNEIITLPGHEKGSYCSYLNENSHSLISGGKDGHLRIWNWQDEKLLDAIPAHNYGIYDLIGLPEKNVLISVSVDKTIKLWQLDNLEFQQKVELKNGGHKHSINRVISLPNNQIATCSDDKKIILWNILSGSL